MRQILRLRTGLALAAAVTFAATLAQAQVTTTMVLKSGERHTGTNLGYRLDEREVAVRTSQSQEPRVPVGQVAYVDFGGTADPSNLNLSGSQEAVVLRDSSVIKGQIIELGHVNRGDQTTPYLVIVRTEGGEERRINANQVARVYFSGGAASTLGHQRLEQQRHGRRPIRAGSPCRPRRRGRRPGFTVRRGEPITVIVERRHPNRRSTETRARRPGGPARPTRAIRFPRRPTGALIGRINNGQPFLIGSQNRVTVPEAGQLFLGINDSYLCRQPGQLPGRGPAERPLPASVRGTSRRHAPIRDRRHRQTMRAGLVVYSAARTTMFGYSHGGLERYAEPAADRLPDEGEPADRRAAGARPLEGDGPLPADPREPPRPAEVRPARRPALRQRQDSHRHRDEQDPQGSRGQDADDDGVRRAVRARLRLPRPADRAARRPRARAEEARDVAGRFPPRLPQLRLALHRRDERGVPAAVRVRRLGSPVPDDGLPLSGGDRARARTSSSSRGWSTRARSRSTGASTAVPRSPKPKSSTRTTRRRRSTSSSCWRTTSRAALAERVPALAGRDVSVLIWTTTPWTIPSNLAIAFHPDFDYAAYDVDGRAVIVAEALAAARGGGRRQARSARRSPR